MPNVYLDQNALIYAGKKGHKDARFSANLLNAVASGRFTIILSPWHWVETARTKNLAMAGDLADFMDKLCSRWLRDRRDLERLEVHRNFFKFIGVDYPIPPPIFSRVELIAALNRVPPSPAIDRSSREFVEAWIKHPDLMRPIEESYAANANALKSLRSALAAGKLTSAIRQQGDRKLIEGFLPSETPAGIAVDSGTRNRYLDTVNVNELPSLAVEFLLAEKSWASKGGADWNTMVDKFHLIAALPYVDVLVSDDGYFHSILPILQSVPFPLGRVLRFADFCKEFIEV
jgi:hypothetical protein